MLYHCAIFDKILRQNIKENMDKEKKNIRIICVKAPKVLVPFLKMFIKKDD